MFFNKAPEVLKYGSDYLNIIALTFGFTGIMIVSNGIFKGAGRTVPPMVISIISQWGFRLWLGFYLSRDLGLEQAGLWWAIAIANIGGAVIGVTWLKLTDWSTGRY